ncbi:hypothetical protein L204_101484 [Cryptococcus depauperatus]
MAVSPPPGLNDAWSFAGVNYQHKGATFPSTKGGSNPHSASQGLANTFSAGQGLGGTVPGRIAAPAGPNPQLDFGPNFAAQDNYWGSVLPPELWANPPGAAAGGQGKQPPLQPENPMAFMNPPMSWGYMPAKKKGFWNKVGDWLDGQPSTNEYGYPTTYEQAMMPQSVPKSQRPIPAQPPIPAGGMPMSMMQEPSPPKLPPFRPTPLPAHFPIMSRREQKQLIKRREKEEKEYAKATKEQYKLYEQSLKYRDQQIRDWEKEVRKNMKAWEKSMKYNMHNMPHPPYPFFDPSQMGGSKQLPIPANPGKNQQPVESNQARLNPENYSFMLLPKEEFGMIRPIDVGGLPKELGGPKRWPLMSRTMRQALVELTSEERQNHAIKAVTFSK